MFRLPPRLNHAALSLVTLMLVAADAQVQIAAGTISGTTCDDAATLVYRGIPFAEPPVGDLRFMAPQPLNGSYPGGVLNATSFAPNCIQMPGSFGWTKPSESEDCLYLDVYVPPGNLSGLPVKVWAHGGGNTGGSTSYPLYDLCNMVSNSIAVAINYRLGPFGFLGLDAAGIDGNMGIKDYVAALEWVQENIESFGGDRSKVMLFGQSSGADDTYVVSTLPQAKSLFSSAICESGGGVTLPPYETVQSVGADYASTLNCSSSDLSCLQSKTPKEIVEAYVTTPSLYQGVGTFPTDELSSWVVTLPNTTSLSASFVDGKFITQQPRAVGPQVPIVLGSNSQDGTLFSLPPLFLSGGPIDATNYTTFLSQFGPVASTIAQQYPLSAFNSSNSTGSAVMAAITHILTLSSYTCPAYRGLRSALISGVPAYAYTFAHTPSCPWLIVQDSPFPTSAEAPIFLSAHTAELPFVLGNLANQPFGNGTCNATQQEYELSATLETLWTAMAATQNPSVDAVSWPEFDSCSNQGLYIDNTTSIRKLDFSECGFWDDIWEAQSGVGVANASCSGSNSTTTPPPYTSTAARGRDEWRGRWTSSLVLVGVFSFLLSL